MNGNRMKYASTPTYGMQKRSLFKKSAPAHHAPEAPDFSKAPDAINPMPFSQSTAQMPFPQPPAAQPASFAPAFQPPAAPPVMQQPAQIPFAAPTFVPPVSGMPLPPLNSTQPAAPAPQQLPLGNTIPNGFSTFPLRGQGFVPPQQPVVNAIPTVQPAPLQTPAAPVFKPSQQPFAGAAPIMPPQQPAPGFAPVQPQMPFYPQNAQSSPQQPMFVPDAPRPPRRPVNANTLWSVFLFGLLPLLFIPCLFVPGSWDFLRYAFLVLAVAGLGGMWYRQMYTPSARLIISMVYVALSIGIIAMLMQGSNDVRRTAAAMNPQQPAAQTQTLSSDGNSETPVPVPEETPAPAAVGPSEAERRLDLFMSLWQVNDPTKMVSLVQPSWCSQQENPSQALFNVLKNRTPEDYKIEDITGTETDNSRTITMRASINKNTGKAPTVYRFMVMMVKEGNEWYVNPNSLATNDEVETKDENVVNNKNAAGTVTEPPRTTVTPAPPASTLLYYNDGANYYHMDPNCASVKSEYLPFDFSFSYGDLKSVMREYGLSPCLKCNAPTNTLD